MPHPVVLLQAGMEGDGDEAEAFDHMQHAQMANMDPDSSAFFAARKQVRRKQAVQGLHPGPRVARKM